jgi:hypothetical protein
VKLGYQSVATTVECPAKRIAKVTLSLCQPLFRLQGP